MTLTSALLWFLFPCLGSYLASTLFQCKPEPYQPKEYKNPFDPEDPSTWNYSYSRLMRTYD
jgi:hypothetical protein